MFFDLKLLKTYMRIVIQECDLMDLFAVQGEHFCESICFIDFLYCDVLHS